MNTQRKTQTALLNFITCDNIMILNTSAHSSSVSCACGRTSYSSSELQLTSEGCTISMVGDASPGDPGAPEAFGEDVAVRSRSTRLCLLRFDLQKNTKKLCNKQLYYITIIIIKQLCT